MKKYLIVYYGDAPECVEGFSKECVRSGKGALHVKPGRQMTVTDDELKHLQTSKKCSHMTAKLRVLGEKKDPKKKEEKKSSSSEQEAVAHEEAPAKKETKAERKARLKKEEKENS